MKKIFSDLMLGINKKADGAMVTSEINRRYLTGFPSSAGVLLITGESAQFIVDFRYIEAAKAAMPDVDVIMQGTSKEYYKQITDFFKLHNAKNILIESETLTLSEYNNYKLKLPELNLVSDDALSTHISNMRRIKTRQELTYIEQAQSITDRAFEHICNYIKAGRTERDVALELEYTMKKLGADGLAFDTIVASGIHSSMPHAVPTDKKIENGDFVTMDYGARFNGYCSDMTRTVAVGTISEEQQKVYDTVLQSQLIALDMIKPNIICSKADKAARDYIYNNGYEGCFGHSLGHSVGLFIHEEPRFSEFCNDELLPGTIMTVEPGIYIEGKFGVRIEDMVYVDEKNIKNLTKSEKKLITL